MSIAFAKLARPVSFAGRVLLLAAIALAGGLCFGVAETPDELLQRADQLKTADNSAFQALIKQLEAQSAQLTATQREWFDYLRAWQAGYLGNYADSISAFDSLLAHASDPTVRTRARISLVNNQINATHYQDAYVNLDVLMTALPQVQDRFAHFTTLIVATILYNQAGQYDLAQHTVDEALAYDPSDRFICMALTNKVEGLFLSGKLRADNPQVQQGVDACQRVPDPLYANVIRVYQARALIDANRNADALQLLQTHDAEILGTHSAAATSQFRATLARASLNAGDLDKAKQYAQSAIDYGIKQAYSKSVADGYQVLYEIAKQRGDDASALAAYEKYAAADKGYISDVSARALAYQMVHQQVLDKKREVDALNEKNKVLQLQGEIKEKSAENRLLYIALLLVGLSALALWALRVKRSEQKFQKLARRDGLTGIYNRQHFFELASDTLRYCNKSARDASVLVLDLDHFKNINDEHGHAKGDEALRSVVVTCQTHLRSIDIFGRLGGEEFAILLPDCAESVAAQRADEIRSAIAMLGADADGVTVTASFGVASTQRSGYELATLLADADNALYAAKNAGRNRVAVHCLSKAAHAVNA